MIHILRRTVVVFFLVMTAIHLSGCAWSANLWDGWFGPEKSYQLFVYKFTTRETERNKDSAVEYLPGRKIYLDRSPVVSSKNIRHIGIIDHTSNKSMKSLMITLDGRGRSLWTQLTAVNRNSQVICMLDGQYMGPIELTKLNETGRFVIPGPFTQEEADKIVEKAPDFR